MFSYPGTIFCIYIHLGLLKELEEKEKTETANGNIPNGSTHKSDKSKHKENDNKNVEDEKSKEPDYTPEQLAEVKRYFTVIAVCSVLFFFQRPTVLYSTQWETRKSKREAGLCLRDEIELCKG